MEPGRAPTSTAIENHKPQLKVVKTRTGEDAKNTTEDTVREVRITTHSGKFRVAFDPNVKLSVTKSTVRPISFKADKELNIKQESTTQRTVKSPRPDRYGRVMDSSRVHSLIARIDGASDEKKDSEELGSHVASRFSSKVSKFFDYYNEALRKRLVRELEKPVPVHITSSPLTSDSGDDSDDEPDKPKAEYSWRKVLGKANIKSKGRNDEENPARRRHSMKSPGGTMASGVRRRSETEIKRAARRDMVLKRFRKKARIIIFCIRCVNDHSFKFREKSEMTPYINTLNYIDYRAQNVTDLMFDRSKFRADRQMRVSEETKRILSMRKKDRTEQELYTAQIALRNIKSFAELPARMQRMLARAGQYDSFESKRVITRECHPASSFYFILSGAVVAMKMDNERPIAIPIDEYVKGDTFEETPMITDTPREMTVLTKEPCEFLSISVSDYKNIFMQGGVKNLNDPDQELFLKSLSFLKNWPIKILQEHPKECRFHYFKRGAILANDTQTSDWLIVVKSGSVSILKKLKKVGPYEWKKNNGLKPLTEKEKRDRHIRKEQWHHFVMSELRLPLKHRKDIEEIEERVDGKPKPFEHPEIKVHLDKGKKSYYPNLWSYKGSEVEEMNTDKREHFASINKQFLYTMTTTTPVEKDGKRKSKSASHKLDNANNVIQSQTERPRTESSQRLLTSPALSETSLARSDTLDSIMTSSTLFEERLKAIDDGVEIRSSPVSETDRNPQFVKIQTLIKGDVWGLADLIFDEQPSLMVVSNGADCVLIDKQFYMQHCSEKLQRMLTEELCPYPSDSNLQESLQVSVDWNAYRNCELSSTMQEVRCGNRRMRDGVFGTEVK